MSDPASRRAAWTATLVAVPVALLAGLLTFWLLGGPPESDGQRPGSSPSPAPTTAVSAEARDLSPRTATVCRGLLARLPGTIRSLPQREVTAGAEQNAAYGEPPVQLRCGVARKTLPDTSTATVYPLSGACWLPNRTGTVWTTVDREVPVAILVPKSRPEPGQWVAAFSRYVAKTPPYADAPSGCRK